jgi:WD40 repeat protein
MRKSCWLYILSVVAAVLLSANLTLAKGSWSKVEISGAGLSGVVEVTDPQLLDAFEMTTFQDFDQGTIDPPEIIGGGYKILRGWDDPSGHFLAFDEVVYYSDPAGGRGYLYYAGIINGSSEYDHRWYRVSADGEAAMQTFFADQGVTIDAAKLAPARVLYGHTDPITILQWSPDGSLLASSAGGWDSKDLAVRVWSKDNAHYHTLFGHNAPVQAIAWSPDGTILATGSTDQTIRLWDVDGHWLKTIEANKGGVFDLDWSPDGKLLASASLAGTRDNTIQIWDADGTLLHTLPTEYSGGKFLNVEWSPDGQYLAGGAVDYKEWRADGTLVTATESCESCTPAWGMAWSPDSQQWAIGNESGTVWVYAADGTALAELHNEGNVDVMAWSPDGKLLAGGDTIWAWNGTGFDVHGGMQAGRVWSLAWSPDSSTLATADSNRNRVDLWDTTGKMLGMLRGQPGNIQSMAWSPDGTQLASGGTDATIRLWDLSAAP